MKIGIDIDNVITNTFKDLADYFNDFFGIKASSEEVVRIMRKKKLKMWLYWFKSWNEKMMTKVTPIEGAIESIKALHLNHDISLITSRLSIFNSQTKEWLEKHGIPYHSLHHAKEKTKHKKAPGCDIFIEDNIDECEILADHCKKVFLLDQPWNKRAFSQKNIIRVNNWDEIIKHIG